jgi:regulator of ribonuclease activity A
MDISTPDLCDKYPGIVGIAEPVFKSYGGRAAFSGAIVTVKCFEDNSFVKELAGKDGTGKVLVVDGGGSLKKALLGDLIAASAAENGWAGIVIYGAIRDVEEIGRTDLGVFALASIPLKTERKGAGETDIPVTFAGVTFNPGEYLYADGTGLIVSPEPLTL